MGKNRRETDRSWYGYAGKLLWVDLTRGVVRAEELDPTMVRDFIGGIGIAGKILYDKLVPGVDALDASNPLILMTGPLTGTSLPGCVNFSLATRSPLNGFAVCTNANGRFGRSLKFAGYDGLVLEGKSPRPVYLFIDQGQARLLDAAELAGKDVYETPARLRELHGDGISVGCIGPAGEKLVSFAGVLFDDEHSASKGGTGAVLGSKNVKALVVDAPQGKIRVRYRDKLRELAARWVEVDDKYGLAPFVSKQGMRGTFDQEYQLGIVPIKNLTTCDFPEHERFNFEPFSESFDIRKNSCPTCNFNHFNRFTFEGEDLKEPSFDTICGYGPNIGISDPVQTVRLLTLVDHLGLESQEASWTLSFLMECYEAGLIGPADLDGLELNWGAYEASASLLDKIARREGCGEAFADGVYQSALRLGRDALDRAIYVKKGGVPQLMDNRNDWPFTFAELVTNVGSREVGSAIYGPVPDAAELGIDYPSGLGIAGDQSVISRHHALIAPRGQVINFIGLCQLHGASGLMKLVADALEAVTGYSFSEQELLQAGTRFMNLMRAYNVRNGHTREHDAVSPRFVNASTRGLNAGRAFADHLPEVLQQYYRDMGWDEDGAPKVETLKSLGLNYVTKDLDRK